MAVAGRVAIRPRGAFDIGASYKRLDLVKYQNTLFLAKKAVSGVLPAEGEHWMDCGGTDLSDIEKKLAKLEVPEFTEAEELEALEPKKQAGTLWGRVAKAVSSLIAHLGNKNNPHKVTASQTGAMTKGDILNSTVATEAGQAAADAVQLNKEVEGSYAAGVAEEISGINADLANITNAEIKYLDVQKKITAVINNKICSLYINGYGSETGANFGKIDSLFAPTKDIYVPVTIVGYGSAVFRISTDGNLYLYNDDCSIYLDQKEIYGVVTYLIS